MTLPPELEPTRAAAQRAIAPIRPVDAASTAAEDFLFTAKRTEASRRLPPHYLVYFLLVDLLGFENLGQSEKVAWSVPIDFEGRAFLIDHRKFGVGVFAHDPARDESSAEQIVSLIVRGVSAARPFFDWLAEQAIHSSTLNVENKSRTLYGRFRYLRAAYSKADKEAQQRADERHVTKRETPSGSITTVSMPGPRLQQHARWMALATVDAFFSWTEHVFILLAILRGTATTGHEVADLADAQWQVKFKGALDLSDPTTKVMYDHLVELRRQIRNYMAHGAFGKEGEAFSFHSGAGAVPLMLPHKIGRRRFAIHAEQSIADVKAMELIDGFVGHLKSGERQPAYHYVTSGLPLVLTLAQDGTYATAMKSASAMKAFVLSQEEAADQAANMDW